MGVKMNTADPGWLIIANPASGGGSGSQTVNRIEQVLTNLGITYEIRFTNSAGHAIELARQAIADSYSKIAIAGGDGTCHEVVNGVLSLNDYKPVDTEFAVLSSGRGNDWIKTHGIHTDIAKAAALLRFGRSIRHDAGLIEYQAGEKRLKRVFVNMSGMAIAADALERASRFKNQNKLVYLNALIRVLLRYRAPAIEYIIDTGNGEQHVGKQQVLAIIVGNCRYAGSGMLLAPKADPTDGILDVTFVETMGFAKVIGQLPRLFRGGLEKHGAVHLRSGTLLRFETEHPVRVEADGELLGTTPCTYTVIPAAFRLRVPLK